jgi:hypothetical protein
MAATTFRVEERALFLWCAVSVCGTAAALALQAPMRGWLHLACSIVLLGIALLPIGLLALPAPATSSAMLARVPYLCLFGALILIANYTYGAEATDLDEYSHEDRLELAVEASHANTRRLTLAMICELVTSVAMLFIARSSVALLRRRATGLRLKQLEERRRSGDVAAAGGSGGSLPSVESGAGAANGAPAIDLL